MPHHRPVFRWLGLAALWTAGGAAPVPAASVAKQITAIYAPFRVQEAALAPDGRHVAFTVRNGRGIEVQIFDVDRPDTKKIVPLDSRPAAETRFLAWASADRLVAASDAPVILAIDASGRVIRTLTDEKTFAGTVDGPTLRPTVRVLGLMPDDAANLMVEVTAVHLPRAANTAPPPAMMPPVADVTRTLNLSPGDRQQIRSNQQRSLAVADRPGEIVSPVARPEATVEVCRLNLTTGERQRTFGKAMEPPGGSVIVDWQGTARLCFLRGRLPQRFDYRPPEGGTTGRGRVASKAPPTTFLDEVLEDRAGFAFRVTPENFLGERTIPLGFDADPNILYFASNLGRSTYGIYAADLRTGKRTPLAVEEPEFDLVGLDAPWLQSPLVFDPPRRSLVGVRFNTLEPTTRWLDAEIDTMQTTLAEKFPGRHVQLLGWDDARTRFLALVTTNGDPGRYFVFHRADDRCVEYLRRAPVLDPDDANRSEPFGFVTPAGERLTGYLTLPHAAPVAPPALVVWLHDGPWQRVNPGFDRDAQALAAMGFFVVEINYAGSAGFGHGPRESIRQELDQRPVDSVLAMLNWLEGRRRFDRKRVAVVGEGFGGYLALRALQLQPAVFRCGVAVNAPTDLADLRYLEEATRENRHDAEQGLREIVTTAEGPVQTQAQGAARFDAMMGQVAATTFKKPPPPLDFDHELFRWFVSAQKNLGDIAVAKHPDLLTQPVFLVHDPDNRYAPVATVQDLRRALERHKRPPAYLEISPQFSRGLPAARAPVLRKIGEFLNTNLYDFDVKIGEPTEKD